MHSAVSRSLAALNAISLDAPLVAMTWQWAFSDIVGTSLDWWAYVILGGSVWCIYVLDRALDVFHARSPAQAAARHRFARRHLQALLVAGAGGVSIMVAASFLVLPVPVLLPWIALSGLVCAYFAWVHWIGPGRMWIPKEFLVALLFAAGSSFFVVSAAPHRGRALLLPILGAVLLFFGNAAAISKWESGFDRTSRQSSIALDYPRLTGLVRVYLSALALLAIAAVLADLLPWTTGVCIASSALLLLALDRFDTTTTLAERRELADLVLLTPLLIRFFC